MASNRPRSRSTSAAYRRPSDTFGDRLESLLATEDLLGQVADFGNAVARLRHDTAQRRLLAALTAELPRLTEQQLAALGESDSPCPICLTPFLALLAEEETALAMDSPAHPVEDLGVTRLARTCGHVFCRKDIAHWMREGRNSCPKCRRALVAGPAVDADLLGEDAAVPGEDAAAGVEVQGIRVGSGEQELMRRLRGLGEQGMGWRVRSDVSGEERGRDEFAGMYS